jgi:hypothetical protein
MKPNFDDLITPYHSIFKNVSLYELKQDNHRYKSKPKQEDPSPS